MTKKEELESIFDMKCQLVFHNVLYIDHDLFILVKPGYEEEGEKVIKHIINLFDRTEFPGYNLASKILKLDNENIRCQLVFNME